MVDAAEKINLQHPRHDAEAAFADLFNSAKKDKEHFKKAARELCRKNLYFLLGWVCGRVDVRRDWLYDRCKEVQEDPDGCLDLWARDHYKSTLITFGKTIQDILTDPEITVGIFSHTRPIAKAFLQQIKTELENNELLQYLFHDVLYDNPKKDSGRWSLDSGIVVRRNTNPKEATVEAWGLVDGHPTSKHFRLRVYDDVVTRESVYTAEMIKKTTDSWELSLNLGTQGGVERYIGTRYHANDTYATMMNRGSVRPRLHPATDDGQPNGRSVFLQVKDLEKKRRDMGSYTFACQMLQNPKADGIEDFNTDDLRFYDPGGFTSRGLNLYLLCDPASSKNKDSDYTVMIVMGLGPDKNYYVVDCLRDRLSLAERARHFIRLHREAAASGNPIVRAGYEKYGKDSDIEHIESVMAAENYRFKIHELGGSMPKTDRIKRLTPKTEEHRFWMPMRKMWRDYEGRTVDVIRQAVDEEFGMFPVSSHDDFMDCAARIFDIGAEFPAALPYKGERHNPGEDDVRTDYDVLNS